MEKRVPITKEDKENLFVIVDSESPEMVLKRNEKDELETDEGLEGAEFFSKEEVDEFFKDHSRSDWKEKTFGEAMEFFEVTEDEFEIITEEE